MSSPEVARGITKRCRRWLTKAMGRVGPFKPQVVLPFDSIYMHGLTSVNFLEAAEGNPVCLVTQMEVWAR